MVVEREKYLVESVRRQTERSLVALQTLNPTTAKGKVAREEAMACLKEACTQLKTLCRHYRARGYRQSPLPEVHSDLP